MVKTTPRKWVTIRAVQEKIPNPCNGCIERKVGCHSGCPKEAEWKAKVDAEYKKAEAVYQKERLVFASNIRGKSKTKYSKGSYRKWNEYYRGNKN